MRLYDAVEAPRHCTECESGVEGAGLAHFALDGVGEDLIEQLVGNLSDEMRVEGTVFLAGGD